jgi:2-hydroxychromene-2-carboxylate isomerase
MRIDLAVESGLSLRWRPFLLGLIFRMLGWNDSPFNIFAAKERYMWRDLERVCKGLPSETSYSGATTGSKQLAWARDA